MLQVINLGLLGGLQRFLRLTPLSELFGLDAAVTNNFGHLHSFLGWGRSIRSLDRRQDTVTQCLVREINLLDTQTHLPLLVLLAVVCVVVQV